MKAELDWGLVGSGASGVRCLGFLKGGRDGLVCYSFFFCEMEGREKD